MTSKRDPAGYPSDSPPGPFFMPLCAQPLAGGAFEQLQHVLVAVAGRLRHTLLTGAVSRNVCGELLLLAQLRSLRLRSTRRQLGV